MFGNARTRRVAAIALGTLLVAAGCGGGSSGGSGGGSGPTSGPITLTMWYWGQQEAAGLSKFVSQSAAAYHKLHPNITVVEDNTSDGQQYWDALTAMRKRLEGWAEQGIILRDAESGLVDFPSRRDGREVFLCWRLGEDRVGFWHPPETGFSGRRPL